jgi:phosphoglycerate-specific signal transduction histidine kinase
MQEQEQPETSAPLSQLVHDLNQPLSAISTYAHAGKHLVDNGIHDPQRLKELFGKIATQCGRATLLSHQLGKAVKALPAEKSAEEDVP